MKHPLTQHKISSPLALAQYIKSGNQTVLDSIEFDLFVDEQGEIVVGHPGEVRRGLARAYSVDEFFELLKHLRTNHIVIDVKARLWNDDKKQAEFAPGAIDTLLERLPGIIDDYAENREHQGDMPEIVVATVDLDFFHEIKARDTKFPEEVKLRAFTRDKVENEFQQALELRVNQVGIEFPKGEDPTPRLDQLLDQSRQGEAANLEVSFYTIDDEAAAKAVRERFPDAEIITNISAQLEGTELAREQRRPMR
ncbi:MAG: hypothetical protein CO132_05635 [Candidatus Kerfeldbacteria bacterium CG_4_9_14_3_um_filter_45_8]|nr:MAG: hypothetical protein CO132_05635 [Candidatus Kerfeldbacteria bacterium CG_4_9_14_3_um_filter_45_8]